MTAKSYSDCSLEAYYSFNLTKRLMDNNRLRGGSNLSTLVFFFLIQEIFRVLFTANVSFKWRNSQNTILMKKNMKSSTIYPFIHLSRRPFLIYYLFYFFAEVTNN